MARWWHRILAAVGAGKTETDVSYDPVVQDTRDGGTPGAGGSDLGQSPHQKPRNWPPDNSNTADGDAR
jgi:hypothetical protein